MSTTTLTRDTIASDRQLDVQIRASDDAGRTFTGIGVPYGDTIELWGMRERFEPGAVNLDADGVPSLVLWRHDEPIGKITAGRDTDAGFEIDGALSDTPRGREAATLLRDGVITRLSIGFRPEQYRIEVDDEAGTETVVHESVRALEFSLVPFPAYSAATITKVRHRPEPPTSPEHRTDQGDTMTTTTLTRADLDPIETELQDVQRKLSTIDQRTAAAAPAAPHFRSMGDYLKQLAAGDEYALEFHKATTDRAFDGQTTEGAVWNESRIGTFIKFVQDRRRLINLFTTGALPADGMSVDYAQLKSNTLKAGKQTAEGAALPGPGKVVLETKSEPISTYGGWTELSRQTIERSSLPYLETVMTALGLEYAKATNAAFRTRILSVITSQKATGIKLPATPTAYDWRDAIVDAGARYDETGFSLTGLLVSTDVFKALQRLEYTHIPALTVREGDEFSGTLDLPKGDGDFARVEVHALHGEAPAGTAAFYDPVALKTLESPNAPTRLQDDNIINLSRQFSLYGYLATIVPFPTAIVPVTTAGGGEV